MGTPDGALRCVYEDGHKVECRYAEAELPWPPAYFQEDVDAREAGE